MEGEGGGGESDRRRVTLLDQMSADRRELAGLSLDDVLGAEKQPIPTPPPAPPLHPGRTLLDIIRDEEPKSGNYRGLVSHRDKKSWKSFKDRLRIKRNGSAWTTSAPIPASDIPLLNTRSLLLRHNSANFHNPVNFHTASLPAGISMSHPDNPSDIPANYDSTAPNSRPQISRRNSTRFNDDSSDNTPGQNIRPQISRRLSVRFAMSSEDNVSDQTDPPREGSRRLSAALADERSLSAREAVAAQEAAEAAAAAAVAAEETGESQPAEEGGQVRMSLMDLLDETDRQMGFEGSRYMMGDEDDDEEEEGDNEADEIGGEDNGVEHNCCVCMVRHKGAAFIPCGHTFCRLCSRELWVSRGNCPLCNNFILEILDIF